jgi:hypothetical protein
VRPARRGTFSNSAPPPFSRICSDDGHLVVSSLSILHGARSPEGSGLESATKSSAPGRSGRAPPRYQRKTQPDSAQRAQRRGEPATARDALEGGGVAHPTLPNCPSNPQMDITPADASWPPGAARDAWGRRFAVAHARYQSRWAGEARAVAAGRDRRPRPPTYDTRPASGSNLAGVPALTVGSHIQPPSTIHRCAVHIRLSSAASQSTSRATSSG